MTQWRTFLLFYAYFKFVAIPASLKTVCLYIQFLSRSFKSVESVKNYISGIRTLHLFLDESFPYFDEFVVKLLFRGIERNTQHSPKRALAITIDNLLDIYNVINHNDPKQSTIWCLFLFAFFLMARKSNLVPDTKSSFDRNKQMTRNKVVLEDGIAIVICSWSKTIQMGDRILKIPLVENKESKLCPVAAYMNMRKLIPAEGNSPAFLFPTDRGVVPVTYVDFQRYLKFFITKIGKNPLSYSSHSFRRGGATFAFESNVPSGLIQLHGDWASDAYKLYLQFSLAATISIAKSMTEFIP
jgi:hypothetical protein